MEWGRGDPVTGSQQGLECSWLFLAEGILLHGWVGVTEEVTLPATPRVLVTVMRSGLSCFMRTVLAVFLAARLPFSHMCPTFQNACEVQFRPGWLRSHGMKQLRVMRLRCFTVFALRLACTSLKCAMEG